ncbi:MAG: TIGR03067 domain-containing protein [Planctomycetes bacterium]|nr:TIGR03067 domain-containing protein [Planctomycetota bacterium]
MTRFLSFVAACALIASWTFAAEPAEKAADKSDEEQVIGTWRLPKDAMKLIPNLSDDVEAFVLAFDSEGWKLTLQFEQGSQDIAGSYAMEPKYTPKTLDMAIKAGAQELGTISCLYKIDGDKLTIRFSKDQSKTGRPADLDSDSEDYVTLVFEREKKE